MDVERLELRGESWSREGKKMESRVGRKHTAVSAEKAAFPRVNTPPILTMVKKSHFRLCYHFSILCNT